MLLPFLQRDVPLAPLTTLGIGGSARFFAAVDTLRDLRAALAWARAQSMPTFVLGGGSNILVADAGFEGLVLQYRNARLAWSDPAASAGTACRLLVAGAAAPWDAVVQAALSADCAGIECLAGIPGTVGAAPVQNIGAYGQELAQSVAQVHAVERASGALRTFDRAACGFGYRDSLFKSRWRDAWCIVRVDLRLTPAAPGYPGYGELQTFFAAAAQPPSVIEVAQAVVRLRARKSMVLGNLQDPNRRSVGSFFMNPVVSQAHAEALLEGPGAGMPRYPAPEGCKLSAAWLIEHAGFGRGYVHGPAGISSRHALALINRGGARAADMVSLAAVVRAGVHARFRVALVPEAQLIGFSEAETRDLFAPL